MVGGIQWNAGIPNDANILKYVITELAKATFPFPSESRTLDIYGKVIIGNKTEDAAVCIHYGL